MSRHGPLASFPSPPLRTFAHKQGDPPQREAGRVSPDVPQGDPAPQEDLPPELRPPPGRGGGEEAGDGVPGFRVLRARPGRAAGLDEEAFLRV